MIQRADQWLWFARLTRSRTLASTLIAKGALRVNGAICTKPAHAVKTGDVLTFAHGRTVQIVQVVSFGVRRGPAPEAQQLYQDLTPTAVVVDESRSAGQRAPGEGRPTKRDRRVLDAFHASGDEDP